MPAIIVEIAGGLQMRTHGVGQRAWCFQRNHVTGVVFQQVQGGLRQAGCHGAQIVGIDELVLFGTHDQHGKTEFRQARHQVGAGDGGDELRQQHVLAQVQPHLPDQARDAGVFQVRRVQQFAQALARNARIGIALEHGDDALARFDFRREQTFGGIGDQSEGLDALRVPQRVFERQVGAQRKPTRWA